MSSPGTFRYVDGRCGRACSWAGEDHWHDFPPDPLRPADTDRAPLLPVTPDEVRPGPVLVVLWALALAVIVGVLVLWAAR